MKDNNTDTITEKTQDSTNTDTQSQTCDKDGSCCGGACLKDNTDDSQSCCQYQEDGDFPTCNQCQCFCGGCECLKKKTFWKSEAFIFLSGILLGIVIYTFLCFLYSSFGHNNNSKHNKGDYRYEFSF